MPNYTNSLWREATRDHVLGPFEGEIEVDVAIVGAGITGVTAARLLKDAGLKVALLEAKRVGTGETGRTSAHLTSVLDTRYHKLISNFGEDGARAAVQGQNTAIDRIKTFVDELEIDCRFQRVPGYLYSESENASKTIEREEEAARRLGIAVTQETDLPLPFPFFRALRFERQAQFDPIVYLLALVERIDGDGSQVFEECQVLDIEEGEPCGVATNLGMVRARDVILATHVPNLARASMQAKLASYRTYVVGVKLPDAGPAGLFWDTDNPYHYIRTHAIKGESYLLVGGEDHKVGEEDHTTLPFQRLEDYVITHFGRSVAPTDFRWSGQIIEPADGLPYIGQNPGSEHIYVATGFSGNGITGGTLAAMILADDLRGIPNPWSELFDPRRFKPLASAKAVVAETIDFPVHLVSDRLHGLGGAEDLQKIPVGEGQVLQLQGNKLAVYRDSRGEISAVSPECTHLGCLVHWNSAEKSWDCPCHGSRFDPMGRVLNGPATSALESRPVPKSRLSRPSNPPQPGRSR